MANLDYHKTLCKILCGEPSESLSVENDYIELSESEIVKNVCTELNIETESLSGNRIRLITSTIQVEVFQNIDSFLCKKRKQGNFLILNDSQKISYIGGITYIDFCENSNHYLVSNHINYNLFQEFLKQQEKEFDGTFHFVDSYNVDLRKLVFVSIAEMGRLTIRYEQAAPLFNISKDYSKDFQKFQQCFRVDDKSLIKFLKTSVINYLTGIPENERFQKFFESLSEIIDKAKLNFEVYLNGVSIDKFKKDYDDLKSKYFSTLSDVLTKVNTNILALPISVATLLFAIEKVKENQSYLSLIAILIFLTSFFLSLLLKSYIIDIQNVYDLIKFDYSLLEENNFFVKFPSELKHFQKLKKKVIDRIKLIRVIILSYFWVLNISNILIIYSCIGSYFTLNSIKIYFALVVVVLLLSFKSYIFKAPIIESD